MNSNQPRSKFGDEGYDNKLTAQILIAPEGPLTQWRRAHPNGDPISWQEDHATTLDLLRRFRGGPLLVDQFSDMKAFDLHNPVYRCQYEGFAGVMYRVNMRVGSDSLGGDPYAPGWGFVVYSIDTPRTVPRTAIRPTGMLDSVVRGRGYQGVKTDDKDFDKHYHTESEDPDFAKSLLTPTFKQYLRDQPLSNVLSFVFDHGTLSTWNWSRVEDADGSPYLFDYMSMMIDYLAQIMKASPAELWG